MEPKALSPSKINPEKLLKGTGALSTTVKKISAKSLDSSGGLNESDILIIKKQVIQIRDLVKTSTLLKQNEENTKRKETEQKRFSEKEERLEKQEGPKGLNLKFPSIPKLGFLDRVKQFLFKLILGKITLTLLPHLPKLTPIVSTIFAIQNNVIDWTGKILNGFVTFVDKGYEAYDKSRNFLKSIGGENFTKAFDGFIGTIDKVIEASIIAAIAFSELKGEDFGPDIKKGGKLSTAAARRGVISRIGRRAFVGTLGKGGARSVLKVVRPFLKRIPVPVIGALIDFGLSVALGENPGRAAFKAIGAGLLGAVGAAAGSVVPFAGTFLGGLAGGILGDVAGGALYDMFFSGKKSTTSKVQGRAQGGSVTRGGKLQTGPTRTIKKTPIRQVTPTPSQLQPGSDVGGEDKITKVFSKVEDDAKNKGVVNPLGYIEDVYKTTSKINYFGPLFGLVIKKLAGDKIDTVDYKNVGLSLNAWMNNTFSSEVLRTGGAFAEGGEVNAQMFMQGEDLSNVIAKSVEESVSSKLDKVIDDLEKQLMLKPLIEKQKEPAPGPGGVGIEGPEDFSGSTGAEKTMHYLISQGLTAAQAAGIAGNLQQESGFNPGADNGSHHGIAQWDKQNRWPRVSAYITSIGRNPNTLEGQLVGLKWEAEQRGDWREIKKAGSARAASTIWLERFERSGEKPGMPGFENRMKYANDLLAKYGNYTPSSGGKGFDGYITGDPSHPNYDPSHGGSNYHDHLSFKDRSTAEKAYKFFTSKGFKVTEFKGYGVGVTGPHSGMGSLHHSGLAFDIPGAQVPIGKESEMSRKVRATLSQFKALSVGGKVHGFTRAILGERGPEFVIDADSTAALEQNVPGFLNALNRADYNGALSVLRNYASYEFGAGTQVVISEKMVPILFPMMSQAQSTSPVMSSGDYGGEHYMDYSYKQG